MEATVTQIPFNASTCPHYRHGHLGDFNARAHGRCSGSAKSLSWCRGWIIRWAGNRWWQVGSSSGIVAQRPVWEGRGQTGRTRGYSCAPDLPTTCSALQDTTWFVTEIDISILSRRASILVQSICVCYSFPKTHKAEQLILTGWTLPHWINLSEYILIEV